ncbi:unnamed protein product [Brugia pahangi]|uniref:7TM_GPCR_Srx domain-containing protein n=1 Tax=Brugia pahangi TaxID=6280 RepID=A0A0N4T6J2_BRUPA|nr:unnamed protein product [Brugia pahangi]
MNCYTLRNVYYLGLIMIVVSTFFLSIERWFLILPLIYYQNHDEEHIFPYCAYELFNPNVMANIQLGVIAIQICSFVIVIVLWTHNNKKLLHRKSQNENVSVRYQLRENVSTSKLLVPFVAIITVFILTGALLHLVLPSRHIDNYSIIADQLITYCFCAEIQVAFTGALSLKKKNNFFQNLFHLFDKQPKQINKQTNKQINKLT